MSRVYLALDTVLNKQWAAKEIKNVADEAQRELVVASLITESNMIKRFDHPAIPRIVDIVDEDGTLFVIMDYVEGRTFEDILKLEGAQAEEDVVDWAVQLCDVLDYLHQRNPPVIYRDMKPANVMLKPNGIVALIDFGIAREYRADGNDVTAAVGDTIQLGTRGFAPPEQYGGSGQTDARTDVYALGATMFNLLTNVSPADMPAVMPPVRQVVPDVSPGLERIIAKATQLNPDDRYRGCAEMAYDLEHYREEDAGRRAKLKRTWNTFVAGCATTAVLLSIGVFGTVMYNSSISSDYGHWMDVAAQTSDETEAAEAYLKAADLRPGSVEPYRGLVKLYRSDMSFTPAEERQLREVILPNITDFERNGDWADLAFSIGKLYWYSYNVPAGGFADNDDAAYGQGRSERIRAASQWMHEAASVEGFADRELASVYADIADFNIDIVPLINEGSDAGLYKPYFERLSSMIDLLANEENDVMRLEAANLALDALETYPRKFRADGIAQSDLEALARRAGELAEKSTSTTERLDVEKARAESRTDDVAESIGNAYIDREA